MCTCVLCMCVIGTDKRGIKEATCVFHVLFRRHTDMYMYKKKSMTLVSIILISVHYVQYNLDSHI